MNKHMCLLVPCTINFALFTLLLKGAASLNCFFASTVGSAKEIVTCHAFVSWSINLYLSIIHQPCKHPSKTHQHHPLEKVDKRGKRPTFLKGELPRSNLISLITEQPTVTGHSPVPLCYAYASASRVKS